MIIICSSNHHHLFRSPPLALFLRCSSGLDNIIKSCRRFSNMPCAALSQFGKLSPWPKVASFVVADRLLSATKRPALLHKLVVTSPIICDRSNLTILAEKYNLNQRTQHCRWDRECSYIWNNHTWAMAWVSIWFKLPSVMIYRSE